MVKTVIAPASATSFLPGSRAPAAKAA